jgi:phenylpropionate dioxygenase-like ring-hydroxylating dioxygenase large terminal subunit
MSEPISMLLRGWYRVVFSRDLKRGDVLPVRYFGRELVVFRGDDGIAHVLDAHCPHMGAHLGHGGRVVGTTIRCPFHGWRFDGEGRCAEVPFAAHIPPNARTRSWPTAERNGAVLVYFDPAGEKPDFEVPPIDDIAVPGVVYGARLVHSNLRQMTENIVDVAHLPVVHSTRLAAFEALPEVDLRAVGAVAEIQIRTHGRVLGRLWPTTFDTRLYGPGIHLLRFDSAFGFTMLTYATPIDEETVDHTWILRVRRPVVPGLNWLVHRVICQRVGRDVDADWALHAHLRYQAKPLISSADGPIPALRRWISQFDRAQTASS